MTFRQALISTAVVLHAVSAHASLAPLARCEKVKLAAAAASASRTLKCYAKAVRAGAALDMGCVTASSDRLSTTFDKAEASNACAFTGEAPSVGDALTALAADLTGTTGGGPSVCGGKKILAVARRVQAQLKAQAKYAQALDPDALGSALAVAGTRFSTGVAGAEARSDCVTLGDAAALATLADGRTADVVDLVRGALATLGARSGRLVGTAVRANVLESLEPAYRDAVIRQFDYVTAEYEFMWGNLEPVQGSYQFGPVDTIVTFAQQHALQLKGAPLVWHLILPAWVNETMAAADLQAAVDQRIDTLVSTYAGKIAVWDVVNEAVDDSGAAYRDSIFLEKLGPDYIREAFVRARAADPAALLFYNDYLAEGLNPKSDFIYRMVVDLLAQGAPIDGVSFQMHLGGGFGAAPSQSSVIANLQRFADLGLRVHISEMDVQIGGNHPAIPGGVLAQRDIYHDMVAACLAVARCDSVTFWGFTDKYTWVRDYLGVVDDRPLPFDVAYRPKPAFFGIRDALLGR